MQTTLIFGTTIYINWSAPKKKLSNSRQSLLQYDEQFFIRFIWRIFHVVDSYIELDFVKNRKNWVQLTWKDHPPRVSHMYLHIFSVVHVSIFCWMIKVVASTDLLYRPHWRWWKVSLWTEVEIFQEKVSSYLFIISIQYYNAIPVREQDINTTRQQLHTSPSHHTGLADVKLRFKRKCTCFIRRNVYEIMHQLVIFHTSVTATGNFLLLNRKINCCHTRQINSQVFYILKAQSAWNFSVHRKIAGFRQDTFSIPVHICTCVYLFLSIISCNLHRVWCEKNKTLRCLGNDWLVEPMQI